MNLLMTAELAAPSDKVEGLELCKPTHLKTKTKLEVRLDKEGLGTADILGSVANDIEMLGLTGADVMVVGIIVEGVPAAGNFLNRSINALGKIGIIMTDMDWDAASGEVELKAIKSLPLTGIDAPTLLWSIGKVVARALAPASGTHHPLTLFDLKQITGAVYDSKQGDATAQEVLDWYNLRELCVLEGVKAKKASIAKAKREAKKAEKVAEKAAKASDKAAGVDTEEKETPNPKAKSKGTLKKKKPAASLQHLSD